MTADTVTHELTSLHEELSASRKERQAAPSAPPASAEPVTENAEEEGELRDQLREFAREVTTYFEEAEKNIAAHPAESVVGAFLIGILVGRLFGKR